MAKRYIDVSFNGCYNLSNEIAKLLNQNVQKFNSLDHCAGGQSCLKASRTANLFSWTGAKF
jgi:hypothetical protein